jgi:hypothetical protein
MFNMFREWLWKMELINSCPRCGGKTMEHGYDADMRSWYDCECGWGK